MEINAMVSCPEVKYGTHQRPVLHIQYGTADLRVVLSHAVCAQIYEWQQAMIDMEDIHSYIDDVEEGVAPQWQDMTPERMRSVDTEILERVQTIRRDSDQWYSDTIRAVHGYEWDHRQRIRVWACPTDSYGQRNGDVVSVLMDEEEFERERKHAFLYRTYEEALAAAQD